MRPRVLAITGDESGAIAWRIWQPFAELRARGYYAQSVHKDESHLFLPKIAAGYYDAVVTPRIAWPGEAGMPWQRAIRAAGLCWIYEVDDDVYSEAIVGRQYRIFEHERALGYDGLEEKRLQRIAAIRQADAVIVSSRRLASVVRSHTDTPVYVVPNFIDAKWFRSVVKEARRLPELEGKLTIGWAGGTRDAGDMVEVGKAWTILAEKYPDVHFVVQGHIPELLGLAVPPHRRSLLPWVPLDRYPLSMVNIDIACCAVAPNVFNSAKTPIKWMEFTLAGAACVVTPTLYGPVVTRDYDALVASTVDEWVDALSALVDSDSKRRELQDNARTTVMTHHSLQNNWWRWPEAWADAIARFQSRLVIPSNRVLL